MTWSNVGDEPGHAKIPKVPLPPKGGQVRASGKGKPQGPGHQRPEPPAARLERLRRIASGKR